MIGTLCRIVTWNNSESLTMSSKCSWRGDRHDYAMSAVMKLSERRRRRALSSPVVGRSVSRVGLPLTTDHADHWPDSTLRYVNRILTESPHRPRDKKLKLWAVACCNRRPGNRCPLLSYACLNCSPVCGGSMRGGSYSCWTCWFSFEILSTT